MARKVANGRNKKQTRRDVNLGTGTSFEGGSNFEIGNRLSNLNSSELSSKLREFIDNPMVKYVAGGIATAILSRLATNMGEKYPELSRFLRENIDTFEGRLGQYRSGMGGGQESRV
ncbi:MAG: hypothetical protein ACJ76H_14085 [Bacteriovoracaceae bacterium]